ncbi:MAG: 4-amino-4-deoxychorismate lyase [Leptolyngbyaceae cyanobacterium SL_5_9]|nr:4-amino-4-deoxychorismate lyase [Leptolyngbyaceae cyanobacterium SL_5_9]NJO72984.1 4-amino-4-deoxychorismate lyase [Leptolyngbyaceae cyanobacterium RM1_406_9]
MNCSHDSNSGRAKPPQQDQPEPLSSKTCWYDGKLIHSGKLELAIDDPGLLYGATAFTTLRVYRQSLDEPLTNWQGHCDRLQSTVEAFSWKAPDWQRVRCGAEILRSSFPVLRVTLFPDGREWITGRALPENLAFLQKNGITAWLSPATMDRSLVSHKTGNYLAAWLARQSAQRTGAQEAILLDFQGNWLETSTGNLWGWAQGCWWTPPLEAGILPGLMRSQLISWLKCQNESIREEPWREELVSSFEAIAYSNSVVQVVPIHTVLLPTGSLTYDPNHQAFQQLQQLFSASNPQVPDIR